MQLFSDLSFEDLYEHDSVRPDFIKPMRHLIEAHSSESNWKFFHGYYEGAEGIRYVMDLGTADWVVPVEGKPEQLRVHQLLLRAKLLNLIKQENNFSA